MPTAISVKNIVKSYHHRPVLNTLSFDVELHSYVAIVGNNGAGKSTLINLLAQLFPPDSGEINILGQNIFSSNGQYKKSIGFILAQPIFVDTFSTLEYLKFVAEFQGIPKGSIKQRVEEVVTFLEIDQPTLKINALSQGNQMKVSFAASLIHNPDILIFDEPFSNLDVGTTSALLTLLSSLKGRKTMLITSHDIELISKLCERFLVISKGIISEDILKSNFQSEDQTRMAIIKAMEVDRSGSRPLWIK